ncbi:MAG: class I SAM-dependent methyltransferase [Planctomycetota bacterium]|nr:class I SAM-dependent methyltransferase [Planctomycetota bacterium]
MKLLKQLCLPTRDSQSILDVGCAGGVAFDDFSQFGEVYGIEPDAELLNCIPKWSDRVIHCTFGPEFQSERSYDVLLMLDVIEHIEDDKAALTKAYDILKPGGLLILTVPSLMMLWSVHDEINQHYRRYHLRDLSELFAETAFEIKELRYLFAALVPLKLVHKWVSTVNKDSYQVSPPSPIVNAIFLTLGKLERFFFRIPGLKLPFGSSALVIARKPLRASHCEKEGSNGSKIKD